MDTLKWINEEIENLFSIISFYKEQPATEYNDAAFRMYSEKQNYLFKVREQLEAFNIVLPTITMYQDVYGQKVIKFEGQKFNEQTDSKDYYKLARVIDLYQIEKYNYKKEEVITSELYDGAGLQKLAFSHIGKGNVFKNNTEALDNINYINKNGSEEWILPEENMLLRITKVRN